jgi:3-keto-L-gulonate-6-phosphate decarboxylase
MPKAPWVQISIDVLDLEKGTRLAAMAEEAGADWVETGTPLITYHGLKAIGAVVGACKKSPVLADLYALGVERLSLRAAELQALGVNYLLLHAGGDEMAADPGGNPLLGLSELVQAVSIPVGA